MTELKVNVEELDGGITLVFPRGDIDSETCYLLKEALETAMKGDPRSILIDMSHVPYISSAGLGVVFEAMKHLKEKKAELVLCNLRATTRRVFELVKVFPPDQLDMSREEACNFATELIEKNKQLQP